MTAPPPPPSSPPPPPADDKDWTWVLQRPCPECGFDAAAVDLSQLAGRIRAAAAVVAAAAVAPGGERRPVPERWSALEYACHVRDACEIFAQRARAVAATDGAAFENWDQDEAALVGRYWAQDPAAVRVQLLAAAEEAAAAFGAFTSATWPHRGVRSNGSEFTGDTLARYFLHDLDHHAHDVSGVGG